ncbi:hypothetical protein QJS83_13495 [Bdellovibrio sp. 22V]|uniref:hypothetical protein n=1 Tax=Bdellovibrio TaxID=958 RepID=UPI0025436F38|nr:hypothetical protein [Bdellovibrio sp. 22V]WII71478.1 hypothetical protein QJS83_13495 [Bdellovibrio sp. 22V]
MLLKALLLTQGMYYLLTGVWPLVHMRSFEKVTGPKTDHWLVKTVGILITVTAVILLLAAYRGALISWELQYLAIGNLLVLSAVDIIYVLRRVIWKIYLVDAGISMIFLLWWSFIEL